MLQVASAGLTGMHDVPAQDYREMAGGHALQIQAFLQQLHAAQARTLAPEVVQAAVSARGDPARLVAHLARIAREEDDTPKRSLASLDTLDKAQLRLALGDHRSGRRPGGWSVSHRARVNEMLEQLHSDTAVEVDPAVLKAALRAADDPLRLLDHLCDAVLAEAAADREAARHPLTVDMLHRASSGLLGLHESAEDDFRDIAGTMALQVQAHLRELHEVEASAVDRRVVEGAVKAAGNTARLVAHLARAARGRPEDEPVDELVSLDALADAQLVLAGATPGPPHPASRLPASGRASIDDMLQQLSWDTAPNIPPRVLLAAVRARNDPLVLIDMLADAAREEPRLNP